MRIQTLILRSLLLIFTLTLSFVARGQTVALSVAPQGCMAKEAPGYGVCQLRFQRVGGSLFSAFKISFSISGSAIKGTDYVLTTGPGAMQTVGGVCQSAAQGTVLTVNEVCVTPLQYSAYVNIVTTNDSTVEPLYEFINVSLLQVGSGSPSIPLQDNDTVVSISTTPIPSYAIEAGVQPGRFVVSRVGDASSDLIVNYSVSSGPTAATYITDFTFTDGGLSSTMIRKPVGSVTVKVNPVADGVSEPQETVTITLQPGSGYTLGSGKSATVYIKDY
jgi:hypothetical protein